MKRAKIEHIFGGGGAQLFSQYDLDRTVAKKFTSIAPVNGAEGGEAVE